MENRRSIEEILDIIKEAENIGTDTDLAELLGIKPQNVFMWKSRDTIPHEILMDYCEKRSMSYDWLVLGRGTRYYQQDWVNDMVREGKRPLDTFGERLKAVIAASKHTQEEIADYLGITPNTLTNYIKNKSEPQRKVIVKISKLTNADIQFLMTGVFSREVRKPEVLKSELEALIKEKGSVDAKVKAIRKALDGKNQTVLTNTILQLILAAPGKE